MSVLRPAYTRVVRTIRLLAFFALIALGVSTIAAFAYYDAESHSVSDTLRPALVTVLPLWAIGLIAARVILRRR